MIQGMKTPLCMTTLGLILGLPASASGLDWTQAIQLSVPGFPSQEVTLGQRQGAQDAADRFDEPAQPPQNNPYFRLFFPRPMWGQAVTDYRSDYRGSSPGEHRWYLEIHASEPDQITLSWEDPDDFLKYTRLWDMEYQQEIHPTPGGEYVIGMLGRLHRLEWRVNVPEQMALMTSSFEATDR